MVIYQPNPTIVYNSPTPDIALRPNRRLKRCLISAVDDTAETRLPRLIERYLCNNPQPVVVRPVLLDGFDWMLMGDRSLVLCYFSDDFRVFYHVLPCFTLIIINSKHV